MLEFRLNSGGYVLGELKDTEDVITISPASVKISSRSGTALFGSEDVSAITLFHPVRPVEFTSGLSATRSDHSMMENGRVPGKVNANLVCADQDLQQLCSSWPYFVRCPLECPHHAVCRVLMAEPHDRCLALCSCAGDALDETYENVVLGSLH